MDPITEQEHPRRFAARAWPYALVLCVGLVVLLPRLGGYGLWEPWEPKYAEAAREMRERGSWIVPYYRGEVRLTQPILAYWGIRAGSAVFGSNELGARAGGVALALASMLGVYYAVALLRGRRAGLLAALVLGTLPQFYFLARTATSDVYLFTSLGLCLLFFCLGLFGPARRRTAHFAVAYVAFALAVLAKGPVIACAIVFPTIALYALGRGGMRGPERFGVGRQLLLFLTVFVLVAGPWHVAVLLQEGQAYFSQFILKHNLHRITHDAGVGESVYFYLRVLVFGFLPWCGFIPIALASLVDWRDREALTRRGPEALLILACTVTFTAFGCATTKFAHYLAPLVIPMAVLIGLAIDRTLEWGRTTASRLAWIVATMLTLLPMLDLLRGGKTKYLVGSFTDETWVPVDLEFSGYVAAILLAIAALMLALIVVRSRLLVAGLLVAATLLAHHYTGSFIPALSQHKSLKQLCASWQRRGPDEPIGFYGELGEGIFYYTRNRVELLGTPDAFLEFMRPDRPAFCVVVAEELPALETAYADRYGAKRLEVVDRSNFDYRLVANHPVAPQ